jgi:hypothetical protein
MYNCINSVYCNIHDLLSTEYVHEASYQVVHMTTIIETSSEK